MPAEDRGSHEKRQDKKRRNIQQTKYQNWNSRQNTEPRYDQNKATILWTSESDEERTIPQIAYNGYVHGTRKRGRQKKRWIDMIRVDCSGLHLTIQEATCRTQDRRVWRATIDERLTRAMASPGP